jgi:hypothetical protein
MQVGKLALQLYERVIGPGDIARASRAGPHPGCGFDHGANDLRMLAHAEIIVGAPDHDVAGP